MHKKAALYVFITILLCFSVLAAQPKYTITIKENGQCAVNIELDSNSRYSFELPADAEPRADGAIYIRNQSTITAYTGKANKGTISYTTDSCTVKIKDAWRFEMNFKDTPDNITVIMPEHVYIRTLSPKPIIHDGSIVFGNTDNIAVDYVFSYAQETDKGTNPLIYVALTLAAVVILAIIVWHLRIPADKSAKQNIIKTLPHNERRIINILIENNGEMKRNILERKSSISKSSLANSLNNLEKKNIIKIDRTFVVHDIRLSQWFKGI